MKVIVFDLGGTLMEYVGMPLSWVDYYEGGFLSLSRKLNCDVTPAMVRESVELLKSFNPRINYREEEYRAETIFEQVLHNWNFSGTISDCVDEFWRGLNLSARVFPDTLPVIGALKDRGYVIAALTDLPNGMPDRVFGRNISEITELFDCYISSEIAGYRKPNPKGLQMIAEKYSCGMDDILFVGDESKDGKCAENAGCKFLRISRNGQTGDIRSLNELIEILNER